MFATIRSRIADLWARVNRKHCPILGHVVVSAGSLLFNKGISLGAQLEIIHFASPDAMPERRRGPRSRASETLPHYWVHERSEPYWVIMGTPYTYGVSMGVCG